MPEADVLDVIDPVVPPQAVLPVNTSAVGNEFTTTLTELLVEVHEVAFVPIT